MTCLIVALPACSGGDDTDPEEPVTEVKVGLLAPLTGPQSAEGRAAVQGAQLAVEIVNRDLPALPLPLGAGAGLPALDGAKLRLLHADTRSNPDHGSEQALDLAARNGVAGIIGAYDAEVTEAASKRTERNGVPWINGDTSARHLTDLGLDWFFRVGPTDRMFGQAFFSLLRQQAVNPAGNPAGNIQARQLALVHMADEASNDLAGLVAQLAEEGGFPGALDVPIGAGALSGGEAIDRLRTARPDAVVLIASSALSATELEQAFRTSGYRPPGLMTLGTGFAARAFGDKLGKNAEGWLQPRAWSAEVADRSPAAKAVADLYRQEFKTAMTDTAASSFTAVLTLAQAVQNAGSVQPGQVRSALLALDIPGSEIIMPWSGIEFDENRQNVLAAGVVEQRAAGRTRVVFPGELAKSPVTWAAPARTEPAKPRAQQAAKR